LPEETDRALEIVLKWDSVSCLKTLIPFDHLKCLDSAMVHQSPKCLALLISSVNNQIREKEGFIQFLLSHNKIDMLLALLQNDLDEATHTIFSEIIPLFRNPAPYQKKIEEQLNKLFRRLLRFNPIDLVDEIVASFVVQNQAAADIVPDIYKKIVAEFLLAAPFISRYTKPNDLFFVRDMYSSKNQEDPLAEELDYAQFCRANVSNFVYKLQGNQLKEPKKNEFMELPPSTTGTRRVAAIIEKIAEIRSASQDASAHPKKDEFDNDITKLFKVLRTTEGCLTPISERYSWAAPMITAVKLLSNAPDMVHNINVKSKINSPKMSHYILKYKNLPINFVQIERDAGNQDRYWCHGRTEVPETWQDIEDCFEKLMAFDLKKPKDNNAAAFEAYEKKLHEFYEIAAELVWLVGNTTPLMRGTGTVAEWLLGIVHLQHGLEPPVLKTQFPQLDVLDITFPLSDYKDFFTYFFEQSTLPLRTKWLDMSSISTFGQMKALYVAKKKGRLNSLKVRI